MTHSNIIFLAKKTSIVITVLNEQENIQSLLKSLIKQTIHPYEIIIVDGGSTDDTVQLIESFLKENKTKVKISLFKKKGNRSVGRNFGISLTETEWIVITDAGCIPHKNWLEELLSAIVGTSPTNSEKNNVTKTISRAPEVIAGYYDALPETPFQSAVVPYVLVMSDKVNPDSFLPATRSMALKKEVWQKNGRFDEDLSDNEDYAFARILKKNDVQISFAEKAKVSWIPCQNMKQFFVMIYRFAKGDAYSGSWRGKVALTYARYEGGAILFLIGFWFSPFLKVLLLSVVLYLLWSIVKNYRFAKQGWYWLPVLQITADVGVMLGTGAGVYQRLKK